MLLEQLYNLEKNGSRRILASYCQALALAPRTTVTLNILAGSSPYSVTVKGWVRPQKNWQVVKGDYELRLLRAVQRVFEFEDFVFQCLKALPYFNKPVVECLMQPKYDSRQRYDVLCAALKGELKIWQFAPLPETSLEVAFKVHQKIYSEE